MISLWGRAKIPPHQSQPDTESGDPPTDLPTAVHQPHPPPTPAAQSAPTQIIVSSP